MPKCVTEHYTLTVPADWQDRSMITWVAPNDGKRQVMPNILCSHDRMKDGEDLDAFVNRQLKELMNAVAKFELITRGMVEFGGKPAVSLDFTMNPQGVVLRQNQLFFQPDPKIPVVNTVVATAAKADFDGFKSSFNSILGSVTWAKGG